MLREGDRPSRCLPRRSVLRRLREIAETTIRPENLKETLIGSLQRVLPDDDDEVDEIGSLSQSAEALRITAAAPARQTSVGGDYEG